MSQGGTDHSSHRLVQLGLSERDAVLLLLGLSVISGAVALAARHVFYSHAVVLLAIWFLVLLLFGIYLSRSDSIASSRGGSSSVSFSRARAGHVETITNSAHRICSSDEGESVPTLNA